MSQYLGAIALLIDEYDTAIAYYTRVLGFDLVEDTPLGSEKRWVLVAPPGAGQTAAAGAGAGRAPAGADRRSGGRARIPLATHR